MSANSAVSRAERAIVAGAARRVLGVVSGLARGGPVRETAEEGTPEAIRIAAAVHLGVALAVAGAATAVALLFFALPPMLFVTVFAAVTVALIVVGVRALRRLWLVAGRGWLFWAGIGWGLVVASGAYLTQLTGFVPHLLLAWTLGVLVLGILAAGAVQTAFAGVLAALWVGSAALVGESLLPGLVILAVLLAFPLLARPSRLVGGAAAVLSLTLAVAATLRLLPHTPALPLAVITVVATCGVLRVVAARLPLDALTGAPPRGCPRYGIGWVTNVLGVAALVCLSLPPVLDALRMQVFRAGGNARAGLLLPLGVLLVAAAIPGRQRAGTRLAIGAWVLGCAALVAALALPEPAPVMVTAAVAVATAGYALWRTWPGRTAGARDRAWLVLAAVLLVLGRPWFVAAAVLVAFGGYVVLLATRSRRADQPGSPVPFGAGVEPGATP
jgi:hypothetical protein